MNLTTLAWLGMASYAIHILEEYMFDWRNWARNALALPVEWNDFYVTNCIVVALGIAQAMLAETLPIAPLAYAGLMLINAVLFHIVPVIRLRGRFSPGVVTAVLLFLPVGFASYRTALESGKVGVSSAIAAFVIGGLVMAYPIVMLRLKSKPYFVQAEPAH
ncbi:HXXEE domain-containing protein [Bradyrhizobium sp.]|uniref:HXXEE domain-containing protein n=1 Tax=Bradyrhizobium sp. TaxID=376 RepID=UPI0039E4A457